jgi:hypothetical protein
MFRSITNTTLKLMELVGDISEEIMPALDFFKWGGK